MLLLGGMIGVGLMLAGIACETPPGRGEEGLAVKRTVGRAAESPYTQVAFTCKEHQAHVDDCATCHHPEPNAADKACDKCHSRSEGRVVKEFNAFVPRLKEAMHNPDRGCRACHDDTTEDGLWDCSHCHTELTER